ncbi:N-acetyltransferase [Candidatus Woesearchaeota archaeon]|nr:N-acetyltransferase [Candidatus Woesearchaeota archaeon]
MKGGNVKVHPSAEVSDKAIVGDGTVVWNNSQVREGAKLGKSCILSKNVYVDINVTIGDNVKLQNNVSVFHGVVIEDGVFVGPHVCFTNDRSPRAINPDGSLKQGCDWTVFKTLVKKGASIGANSTIICGVTIGSWALVGAGSVVTKDVPDHGLVFGNPARLNGFVCKCAKKLEKGKKCNVCGVKL